jgi:hypothetical protein
MPVVLAIEEAIDRRITGLSLVREKTQALT